MAATHVVQIHMHAHFLRSKKWPTYHVAVPTGNALASQQSIFRENRLKFRPSSTAEKVSIVFGTNNHVKSCWVTDTQTDRQTNRPSTATLAAHARRGVINPRRACAARVTVLGLCVCCVCVCVYLSICLLPFHVIIRATNDTNLLSGGWRLKSVSDFLWKCFVAKLERFLLVRLHDKLAIFYSTENAHAYEPLTTWLAAILFLGET